MSTNVARTPIASQNSQSASWKRALIACCGLMIAVPAAMAQDGQPPAEQPPAVTPTSTPTPAPAPAPAPAIAPPVVIDAAATARTDPLGRRLMPGDQTVLAFPRATVEQVIPFIVESTGKVVIPQQDVLSRRITVINDQPIPRSRALDLVFFALQQAGVAVIESEDLILLRDQADIDRQPVPVLAGSVSTLARTDLGSIVQKIFTLKHASASNVADIVRTSLPDNAKIISDNDSAQVVVTAPIAILQRIERVIVALDKPPADLPKSETFRLQFADAENVANNIRELFSDQPIASRRGQAGGQNQQQQGGQNQARPQGNQGGGRGNFAALAGIAGGDGGSGARAAATPTSAILRVTSNPQQNSVTVLAEANILEIIRRQIKEEWDRPIPDEVVTPRTYQLKNSDPIKVKNALEGLFGTGTTGGGQARATTGRLSGQFTFQAIPEANRLVVVGKTPDSLTVIDRIIADLDQPVLASLPEIIELKHVQAEDLAEQLNALLAQEGTFAQIRRISTDLSTQDRASPFASNTQGGGFDTNAFARETPTDVQTFWWQRARPPQDSVGSSNLVSKVRIVPVGQRNSVLVLASPEYRSAVAELIDRMDRPGRQVLIACVIAEISSEDATALGLRFSNTAISPNLQDNTISIGPSGDNPNTFTGSNEDIANSLFNTNVLNVGVNINTLIQALGQKTKINILSEPRIFTGDNQEASFFDGQDIPFITDSERNNSGNLVQSFDYRAVGINLRVRPRITPERDVDLKVNLELANIQPSQTLFGGFIVDRRETTTQLIVRDGQTVVISGIMRSEESDIKRKVPGLGDLPLIGGLFQSTDKTFSKTELIAFITPVVVNNREESDKINQPMRERLNQLRGELKADIDKALEQGPKTPTPSATDAPVTPPPQQAPLGVPPE